MMATVPHVTSCLGLRKFQADGFLLTRVYSTVGSQAVERLLAYQIIRCHDAGNRNLSQ